VYLTERPDRRSSDERRSTENCARLRPGEGLQVVRETAATLPNSKTRTAPGTYHSVWYIYAVAFQVVVVVVVVAAAAVVTACTRRHNYKITSAPPSRLSLNKQKCLQ